jgi:Phosphopantetheine attachment site
MSIRDIVIEEFGAVAAQQGVALPPLSDDLQLMDAGLDSLFFAILVSRLEDATGSDPFVTATAAEFPRTFGELIAFYERVDA